MTEKSISDLYCEHVKELHRRADAGDEFATKSLACLALVCKGWRYGDPDPYDGPDDDPGGGKNIVDFTLVWQQAA